MFDTSRKMFDTSSEMFDTLSDLPDIPSNLPDKWFDLSYLCSWQSATMPCGT
ncbi:MAG TPA: hypothetical protein VF411_10740 [Bacteroidia bacterium]